MQDQVVAVARFRLFAEPAAVAELRRAAQRDARHRLLLQNQLQIPAILNADRLQQPVAQLLRGALAR